MLYQQSGNKPEQLLALRYDSIDGSKHHQNELLLENVLGNAYYMHLADIFIASW